MTLATPQPWPKKIDISALETDEQDLVEEFVRDLTKFAPNQATRDFLTILEGLTDRRHGLRFSAVVHGADSTKTVYHIMATTFKTNDSLTVATVVIPNSSQASVHESGYPVKVQSKASEPPRFESWFFSTTPTEDECLTEEHLVRGIVETLRMPYVRCKLEALSAIGRRP